MNSQATKNQIDMTRVAILPGLIRFAFPLMLSSLLQLLFNAADVIVIGRFGSQHSLAAVGACGVVVGLFGNVFMNLASGATVVAGKFIGGGKKRAVKDVLHVSMALALFLGIAFCAIMFFFARGILIALQTPAEVIGLSQKYLYICLAGIPAVSLYNFGAGMLRAKGDTKRPLYFLAAAGILNVCLNLVFVIVLKMDVAGVALATIISQYVSMSLILVCLAREEGEFHLDFKKIHFEKGMLAAILRIGIPSSIQCLLFTLSNSVIQAAINGFGPSVMAGNAAAANIEGFVWVCMIAFGQAGMTFVSQNYGARDYKRIDRVIAASVCCSVVTGLVLGQIVNHFGAPLLSIYTSDAAAIAHGIVRLGLVCAPYCLCGLMDSLSCNIRGLGYSALPSIVTLIGACGLRIVWIATLFRLPQFHTTHYLLVTYPVSWIATAAALFVCLLIVRRKIVVSDKE